MMLLLTQAIAEVPTLAKSASLVAPQVPNSQDQLIQVTLALAAVLVLIYALAWFIKRSRGLQGMSQLHIKTVAVMPMGVKEKIVLIEIAGKQILLGMTAQNINTLASFDEPIIDTANKQSATKSFSERLKEILSQGIVPEENNSTFNASDIKKPEQVSKNGGNAS